MPDVPAPVGDRLELAVHQRAQHVEHIAVELRIEGEDLDRPRVELRAPEGSNVRLDDGVRWLGADVRHAHYPTTPTVDDLSTLHGLQPDGEWTVTVTNESGVDAVVTRCTVIVRGGVTASSP